ncbi:deoxyguanosinetriphosphate triphosphohydrolase family protein [Spirochaeta thermophila]|uniref:Deoxyguanosinetriphosphate triphosphohydrolase-like protein n=1 Tax=Winmispira thermophila (strain ATCC 49972 / DSM 6192 / RI 19.B1) TaxID=665571 RepID=E0RT54_WINT6|nr:HD domain-containing protein [Spirochaeta thermophila]ADN02350.1 deoxyguanosinetriphosphate triphosphohydrolase-like protein [Spirochaeta thermophila DSM 6192]
MGNLFFVNPLDDGVYRRRRRPRPEEGTDPRGAYFRDATAIIHSYPFRRLKHKTQVFFIPENDHICTRIEHVMHVATIAATICRALGLDSDLAWAIGVGHDLGHAPFGHLGEEILASYMPRGRTFHHELYSLRVVDLLAGYGQGLNLTYAVRDGIVLHCGERFEREIRPEQRERVLESLEDVEGYPSTWEGCVVRMSDRIAYVGRDLEDALQLRLIRRDEVPAEARRVLGSTNSEIINTLVRDLIAYSMDHGVVGFSEPVYEAFMVLLEFNYRSIYRSPRLTSFHEYFERILRTLHDYLGELFSRYGWELDHYAREHNRLARQFGDYVGKMRAVYVERGEEDWVVFDYIAGMTDEFALRSAMEVMMPRRFSLLFEDVIEEEE